MGAPENLKGLLRVYPSLPFAGQERNRFLRETGDLPAPSCQGLIDQGREGQSFGLLM